MASAPALVEVVGIVVLSIVVIVSLHCLVADTRTNDPLTLGLALFQHQQSGVLPSDTEQVPATLPLLDPLTSTSMPESWVRGAILIRMNSLIRGHSGVRWELIERMGALLRENITPLVPLRGSISASGGSCHNLDVCLRPGTHIHCQTSLPSRILLEPLLGTHPSESLMAQ